MTSVRVVIPFQAGCPHREAALEWVLRAWAEHHPDWPVTVARLEPGRTWCKADAVNPAVRATREHVVVVADSDVWSEHAARAVDALTRHPWAMPHRPVWRLTRQATAEILEGAPLHTFGTHRGLTERPYHGAPAGGMLCAPTATLQAIPLDPRFRGWGGEDFSWGEALTTLTGRPARLDRPLWHLWHPPQPRINRRVGNPTNQKLRTRYRLANNHPKRMRDLINETTQPPNYDTEPPETTPNART